MTKFLFDFAFTWLNTLLTSRLDKKEEVALLWYHPQFSQYEKKINLKKKKSILYHC